MHGILFFIWDGGQIEKKNIFTMDSIPFWGSNLILIIIHDLFTWFFVKSILGFAIFFLHFAFWNNIALNLNLIYSKKASKIWRNIPLYFDIFKKMLIFFSNFGPSHNIWTLWTRILLQKLFVPICADRKKSNFSPSGQIVWKSPNNYRHPAFNWLIYAASNW